ncbi:putative ABC transport system permease protein [Lentzea waywayandensis]|uniref:Putative ABC transport system permease protein n=1 Tax=Lentzea waywayandensis TaxID=84724 RepID=A0A1I6DF70_9PSEU|nr:FtsX-like permease family protein [Lentzea waywayandensis]SFR04095.1 putative ABC transport system permease protein [Lentzea waywayandensis]
MLRTTLAGIRARFLRLVLSSIAIVVGVAFVSGTMVLADALQATMRDEFARSARGVDAVVEPERKAVLDVGTIARVDGVAAAALRQTVAVPIVGAQGRADEADLVELAADPSLRAQEVVQGAFPAAGQIAVSEQTARDRNLRVGAEVVLLGRDSAPERFTVSGVYDTGTAERPGTAELLLPGIARFVDPAEPPYGAHVVVRSSGVDQSVLVERLQSVLGQDFYVTTGAAYAEMLLAAQGGDDIALAMSLFAVVALVVAAMVVMNTFTILIAQRTRELGLLRSIGAGRGQVFRSVLLEATVIGMVASVLGLAAGVGLAAALQSMLGSSPVRLPVSGLAVAAAFAVGLGVTLVAAFLPARRATRVAPMEVLRTQVDSREEVSRTGRARAVVTGVLGSIAALLTVLALTQSSGPKLAMALAIGAGLFLLGAVVTAGPLLVGPLIRGLGAVPRALFGVPAELAAGNAGRNPRRTAATMSALLVGVAVVSMLTVMATSVKETRDSTFAQQFPADYEVSSAVHDRPLPASLLDRITARPGVEAAGAERTEHLVVAVGDRKRTIGLAAVTPSSLGILIRPEVVRGDLSAVRADGIALTDEVARSLGADVGTVVTSTVGTVSHDLRVVALTKSGPGLDAYADLATWPGQGVQTISVKMAAGSDGRTVLNEAVESVPTAKITSFADTRAEFTAQIDRLLAFVWAMIGLAMLTALLGIASTMTLSVFERTRESSLLRALGFTRAQLRGMLVVESILIALSGAVLGAVAGAASAALLVVAVSRDEDLPMTVSVPYGQLAALFVAVSVAGVLAALLPARRAASVSIVAGMSDR